MYRHYGFDTFVSFEYFLEYILKRELWNTQHWFVRPQCDFVVDANGEQCVDYVGRFESIDDDFRYVAGVLDLPVRTLAHVNKGESRRGARKIRALRRYPGIVRHWRNFSPGNRAGAADEYSDEALGIIQELYASDISRFNFQAPEGL
jgi:hypothetical protein